MVVDDDADLRGLICDYLAADGYKTRLCSGRGRYGQGQV